MPRALADHERVVGVTAATPETARAICRLAQGARVVPYADTVPQPAAQRGRGPAIPTGHDEASIAARAAALRRAERLPPRTRDFPIGTFRAYAEGDEEVAELRLVSIAKLQRTEAAGPKQRVAEKYVEWFRRGSPLPPLRVIETERGDLRVQDGHHRLLAADALEMRTIKAWVLLTVHVSVEGDRFPHVRGVTAASAVQLAPFLCGGLRGWRW